MVLLNSSRIISKVFKTRSIKTLLKNDRRWFSSSKIKVIGAAYGGKNVTNLISSKVGDKGLRIMVNNKTLLQGAEDPAKGIMKPLTVVYRIGKNKHGVCIAKENDEMIINPDKNPNNNEIEIDENKAYNDVVIYGASFGLENVTSKVQGIMKKSKEQIIKTKIDDKLFGPCNLNLKHKLSSPPLVVVYKNIKTSEVNVIAIKNGEVITLVGVTLPNGSLKLVLKSDCTVKFTHPHIYYNGTDTIDFISLSNTPNLNHTLVDSYGSSNLYARFVYTGSSTVNWFNITGYDQFTNSTFIAHLAVETTTSNCT